MSPKRLSSPPWVHRSDPRTVECATSVEWQGFLLSRPRLLPRMMLPFPSRLDLKPLAQVLGQSVSRSTGLLRDPRETSPPEPPHRRESRGPAHRPGPDAPLQQAERAGGERGDREAPASPGLLESGESGEGGAILEAFEVEEEKCMKSAKPLTSLYPVAGLRFRRFGVNSTSSCLDILRRSR